MVLALVIVIIGTSAIGFAAATSTVFSACLNSKANVLYNVTLGTPLNCLKGDTTVTWSQLGPQGPTGPQGLVGATGPQGLAGAQGASGAQGIPGPATDIFATYRGGPIDVQTSANSPWEAAALAIDFVDLPAGSYAINATAWLNNWGSSEASLWCGLDANGDRRLVAMKLQPNAAGNISYLPVTVTIAHAFDSPSTVRFFCLNYSITSTVVKASEITITAIRGSTLRVDYH